MLANLEDTKIEYNKLYYKSGNKNRDNFNFEEFATIADLFQRIKFKRINLEDAESKLVECNYQLNSLENSSARKQTYNDKKPEILKNAESLFEGQKLIYTGFIDNTFTIGDEFFTPKQVTPRYKIPDFGIREMFKDMPDLETEESAEKRRNLEGHRLKILTPQQMLSRLPISLAQFKAGNNSEKFKNEIRQLFYSSYR